MMHLNEKSEWFAEWFNSPYYHILYSSRDDNEAEKFIQLLCKHLQLEPKTKVLDLACGAGRHARVMNALGLNVSACDLSENSIADAKKNSDDEINFFVHDMRKALPEQYQVVFNLFTSIGYFNDLCDNLEVFKSVFNGLVSEGLFVIDFMNSEKIIRELKLRQELTIQGITFNIKKEVVNGKIIKTIAFQDKGASYFFQEKVQALSITDFKSLLNDAGFKIEKCFGNYQLGEFDLQESDRLILICKK